MTDNEHHDDQVRRFFEHETIVHVESVDLGEWQRRPRVLARITEEDTSSRYQLRCEGCEYTHDAPSLANVTRAAENHAIVSGHAVLVEAL